MNSARWFVGGPSNFVFGLVVLAAFLSVQGEKFDLIAAQLGAAVASASGFILTWILGKFTVDARERWNLAKSGRSFFDAGLTSSIVSFILFTIILVMVTSAAKQSTQVLEFFGGELISDLRQQMTNTVVGIVIIGVVLPVQIFIGYRNRYIVKRFGILSCVVSTLATSLLMIASSVLILKADSPIFRDGGFPAIVALLAGAFFCVFIPQSIGYLVARSRIPAGNAALVRMSILVKSREQLTELLSEMADLEKRFKK